MIPGDDDARRELLRRIGDDDALLRYVQALEARAAGEPAAVSALELVEHLPLALLLVGGDGVIQFVNRAGERLLGYSPEQLMGESVEVLVPEMSRSRHSGYVAGYHRDPSVRRMGEGRDVVARRKDGTLIPVEIGLAPVQAGGGDATVVSVIDITMRKENEQRLEQSNRDLERFAYVTSHDLQAPLRQVAAFARLLEEELGPQLDGENRENLEFLVEATTRMQHMIRALLEFSRVQEREPEREPVDLRDVVESVRGLLADDIEHTGASFELEGLPVVVGNGAQLALVFQNLIANSLKFRHPDRTPRIRITGAQMGGHVYIEVEDNGIGFDPRFSREVFEMFRRLESRERFAGTGIGLAIVRRIVEGHGGVISATGKRGVGAWFRMEWPARRWSDDSTDRARESMTDGRAERDLAS